MKINTKYEIGTLFKINLTRLLLVRIHHGMAMLINYDSGNRWNDKIIPIIEYPKIGDAYVKKVDIYKQIGEEHEYGIIKV